VTVYREELRAFSEGDRIQFTAPANDLKMANREIGVIERIGNGNGLRLRMDDGRAVQLGIDRQLHLDHGYAVTSHSVRAKRQTVFLST
jgi:ATP-dependent exoDNAse (exonuclease V) alpha subunit